jgi:hypothetical protein
MHLPYFIGWPFRALSLGAKAARYWLAVRIVDRAEDGNSEWRLDVSCG